MLIFEIGLTNTHIDLKNSSVLDSYLKIKGLSYDLFDIKISSKRIAFIIKNLQFTYFYNKGPIVSDKNSKLANDFINTSQVEFIEQDGKYRILSKTKGSIKLLNEYFLNVLNYLPSWNPILWILYLHNEKVIEFKYKSISSNNITYNDFYFEKAIVLNSSYDYLIDDTNKYRSICTFDLNYLTILPIEAIKCIVLDMIDHTNQFFIDHSCSNRDYIVKRNNFITNAKLMDLLFWYKKDMQIGFEYYLNNISLEYKQQAKTCEDIAKFISFYQKDIIDCFLYIKLGLSCFCTLHYPSLSKLMSYELIKKEHLINDKVKNIILDIKDNVFRTKDSLIVYICITLEQLKRNYTGKAVTIKDPFSIKKHFDNLVDIILSMGDLNFSLQDLKTIGFSDSFISFFVSRFNKIYVNVKEYHKLNLICLQHNQLLNMSLQDKSKIINLYKRLKNLSKHISLKYIVPNYNLFDNPLEQCLLKKIQSKQSILELVDAGHNFIDNNIIITNVNRQLVILDIKQFLEQNWFLLL